MTEPQRFPNSFPSSPDAVGRIDTLSNKEELWIPIDTGAKVQRWKRVTMSSRGEFERIGVLNVQPVRFQDCIADFRFGIARVLGKATKEPTFDKISSPLGEEGVLKDVLTLSRRSHDGLVVWSDDTDIALDERTIEEFFPDNEFYEQLQNGWLVHGNSNDLLAIYKQRVASNHVQATDIRDVDKAGAGEKLDDVDQSSEPDLPVITELDTTKAILMQKVQEPPAELVQWMNIVVSCVNALIVSGLHNFEGLKKAAQYLPIELSSSWLVCIAELEQKAAAAWQEAPQTLGFHIVFEQVKHLNTWLKKHSLALDMRRALMGNSYTLNQNILRETCNLEYRGQNVGVYLVKSPNYQHGSEMHASSPNFQLGHIIISEDDIDSRVNQIEMCGKHSEQQLSSQGVNSLAVVSEIAFNRNVWQMFRDRETLKKVIKLRLICEEVRHWIDMQPMHSPKEFVINMDNIVDHLRTILHSDGLLAQALLKNDLPAGTLERTQLLETVFECTGQLVHVAAGPDPLYSLQEIRKNLDQSRIQFGDVPTIRGMLGQGTPHAIGIELGVSTMAAHKGLLQRPTGLDTPRQLPTLFQLIDDLIEKSPDEIRGFIVKETKNEFVHPINIPLMSF